MAYESNAIFWIEVEKIVPNPFQPRREFDPVKLRELSDSIRMYGILQPLVVTRREVLMEHGAFSTEYELIAGERRLRASKLAGLTQVPVIIRSGEESQLVKLELAIIENLQREDLNPVDRALAFKQLAEHFGLSHVQVAQKVGRSREYVSNSIRLLGLPDTILSALRTHDISDGHARTLLMLNDRPEEQDVVFREILLKKLSVREVERIARKIATEKVRRKDWMDPDLIAIEKEFTETLGTRVQIVKTDFGGKLTIDYFEPTDLRKLLQLMHRDEQKHTDAKIFTSIAAAVPLVPASIDPWKRTESTNLSHTEEDAQVEEETTTPYDAQGMDVYTRHDTLAAPELLPDDMLSIPHDTPSPSAPFHATSLDTGSVSMPHTPSDIETSLMSEPKTLTPSIAVQDTPAMEPAVDTPPIVTSAESTRTVSPEDADDDLYSIKNFSL